MPKQKYILLRVVSDMSYIISVVKAETETEFILEDPLRIVIQQIAPMEEIEDGNYIETLEIILGKFFPFALGNVIAVPKTSIVANSIPVKALVDIYLMFKKKSDEADKFEHLLLVASLQQREAQELQEANDAKKKEFQENNINTNVLPFTISKTKH